MRKTIFSAFFLVAFAGYAVYQYLGGTSISPVIVTNTPSTQTTNNNQTTNNSGNSNQTPKPNPVPVQTPTPTPTPTPVVKGKFVDGTYTGPVEDVYYGNVQVKAVVSGGKLTDVVFLQYPSDRSTSLRKSEGAMPVLKSEAISLQSANVDTVSGATETSLGFQQSLGSALTQAKA